MKKNVIKKAIAILIFILIIILCIFIRKIIILNHFFKVRNSMFNLLNYHISVENNEQYISEMYYKNGDYVELEKDKFKNTEQIWYFVSEKQLVINKNLTEKTATIYNSPINPNKNLFPQDYYVIYDKVDFSTLLNYAISLNISSDIYDGEKVYCIQNNDIKTIIRKKDFATIEENYQNNIKKYNWKFNTVTEDDLGEIDLTDYEIEYL